MQATPPPSAQVLPAADAAPVGSAPGAGPKAAGHASTGPEPAHPRPAEPIEAEPPPVAQEQASVGTADAAPVPPVPDAAVAAAAAIPRRPVIEDAGRSRADVPWLGIGSWLLLCGALFASLLGWPGQAALDRLTSIWPSELVPSATLDHRPTQGEAAPAQAAPLPAREEDRSPMAPAAADELKALPPIELAPPIRSDASSDTTKPPVEGPPLPRFKPNLDRVAAKFSNAFLEFGDRLQQEGDFDAAVHMRLQATNLNPWKAPAASNL